MARNHLRWIRILKEQGMSTLLVKRLKTKIRILQKQLARPNLFKCWVWIKHKIKERSIALTTWLMSTKRLLSKWILVQDRNNPKISINKHSLAFKWLRRPKLVDKKRIWISLHSRLQIKTSYRCYLALWHQISIRIHRLYNLHKMPLMLTLPSNRQIRQIE